MTPQGLKLIEKVDGISFDELQAKTGVPLLLEQPTLKRTGRTDMSTLDAYICDAIRTPFGRYGGALSSVRTDDLGAIPLRALMQRNPDVDWQAVGDVIYGCANQAGEDNRNVARMSSLLAGLPLELPARR